METELRQLSDTSQYSFPGVGGLWQQCTALVLAGIITAASVDAQRTPEAHVIEGVQSKQQQRQPRINAVVTLRVTDSTIGYALNELARQAGLRIVYNNTNPAFARRIRVNVTQTKVSDAFAAILRGTGLVPATAPDGETIVIQSVNRKVADSTNRSDSIGVTISGRVIDARTQRGIPGAAVQILGAMYGVVTKEDGTFVLPHLAPGTKTLTARVLGYTTFSQTVVLVSGVNENLTISMQFVPQNLREVVTTGAGDRQRLEVGNSSALINADSVVQSTPIRDLSDLIKSRAPGTQVITSGGTAGAGSRVRIRGVSGLITNSDPILIVDGVRLDMTYSQRPAEATGSTFGNTAMSGNQLVSGVPAASRLDDIDPESIESIEVLKGPSAATLYGSDAANGVIVIKTKRGRPGSARWTFSTTQGMSRSNATYPDVWMAWGSSTRWANPANCSLIDAANQYCTVDSMTRFNPLNHKETSPFGTGYSGMYNSQISGGSNTLQYFLGATYNSEIGVLRMPKSEVARLATLRPGAPLPEWAKRPNVASGTNLTLNLSSQINQLLDVGLTSMFMAQDRRDAAQGSSSYIARSIATPGYRDTIGNGWGTDGPALDFLRRAGDASDRIAGGLQGNFRPNSMFTVNGLVGMDRTNREDETLLRQEDVVGLNTALVTAERSKRGRTHSLMTNRNASISGTALIPLRNGFNSRSVVGVQFQRTDYNSISIEVQDLQIGSDVITGGTVSPFGATENRNAIATLGWVADQSISLRDALFVTGAIRADVGSSFGRQARPMLYPKFNGSWLISQESFFPQTTYLTSLRLRGAFGQAGVQPGTEARFRSFAARTHAFEGNQVTGITVASLGNTGLVPERSIEYEAGFDVSLWNDRMTLDVTQYQKTTDDALISRALPPSFGFQSRQENVGKIRNSGLEISASARPITSDVANWGVTLGYSKNSNKLMKLSANYAEILTGGMRYVEGYPVNAYWAYPVVAYNDNDKNGTLTADEVKLADNPVYLGQTTPNRELSLHSDLGLMKGRVTIATGFNYQGGATQFNALLNSQCISERCRYAVDPNLSIKQQLTGVVPTLASVTTAQVMYDRVAWLRWSDLSVTMQGTPSIARLFRSRNVSMSLMGRNLRLWSKYRGADPEVNTSNYGNVAADAGAIPQMREWSLRFNLNY